MRIWLRDGGRCVYCLCGLSPGPGPPATIDHFVSQSAGGHPRSEANLVLSCGSCNHRKDAKPKRRRDPKQHPTQADLDRVRKMLVDTYGRKACRAAWKGLDPKPSGKPVVVTEEMARDIIENTMERERILTPNDTWGVRERKRREKMFAG